MNRQTVIHGNAPALPNNKSFANQISQISRSRCLACTVKCLIVGYGCSVMETKAIRVSIDIFVIAWSLLHCQNSTFFRDVSNSTTLFSFVLGFPNIR